MFQFRHPRFAAIAAGLALVASACGDRFGTGVFTQMEVIVDNEAFKEAEATVYFAPAIQQPVFKTVKVYNTGSRDLIVSKIDWAVDPATNKQLKNPHIDIDWRGSVNADSFPWTVSTSNIDVLEFAIKYTPPLFGPPESLEDSVLEIHSNARSTDGTDDKPIVRVTVSLRSNNAIPQVTPTNYRFTNATTARPETQDFRIYNADNASAPFRVLSVRLENPSEVFRLSDVPSAGIEIPAPADAPMGYNGVVFKCTYTPIGGTNDSNAILIETDVSANAILRIPLTTGSNPGSYSLSFDHPSEFDFTTESTAATRNVQVNSDGPGPITLREPRIEPAEARRNFAYKAYRTATQAGQQDTEITNWPAGLNVGRAIRIEVVFTPEIGGGDSANGELIIPYENPNAGQFSIPLYSGQPKGRIVVAPSTGNISVSGSVTAGDTGTRTAVIYNEGNGVLQIENVAVESNLAVTPPLPAKVWSLPTAISETDIQPGGMLLVQLAYDLKGIDTISGTVNDLLKVQYFNDYTGQVETYTLGLGASDAKGVANPTADPGSAADYAGATVGTAVVLDGSGSTAGGGAFERDSFIWYLVGKPNGSRATLNVASSGPASFVPDVAGDYTVELTVFVGAGGAFLYSEPVRVTISVAPAP